MMALILRAPLWIVVSWRFKPDTDRGEVPVLTGTPYTDAYRYLDWLLIAPPLLIEFVLACKLSPEYCKQKATALGVASSLMTCTGYPGELIVEGD